ncbi:MAG: hypothetical protein QME49_01400 [bacterium]|nr:hypothetical protein [bacterium]
MQTCHYRETATIFSFLAVILIIISLIPIWSCTYFPSRHGPGYLLMVEMVKQYFNPAYNYSTYYEIKPYLVPNLLFNITTCLFHLVFPILTAYKLALSVNVILWPLSVFYLIKVINPRKIVLGFVSFLYVYNFFFCFGHNHFCLSVPMFFFIFGYWLKYKDNLTLKNISLLNIFTSLLYLCHLFSFVLLVFVMAVYDVIKDRSIKGILSPIRLFIPGFILLVHYIILNITQSSWAKFTFQYNPIHWTMEGFVTEFLYSFSKMEMVLTGIPILCVFYLAGKRLVKGWRSIHNEPILILTGILVLLYFILPGHAFEWHRVNVRMLPFIYIFLLVCAEPITSKVVSRIFLSIIAMSTVCLFMMMTINISNAGKVVEEYTSGISKIEQNKLLLPIMLEKEYSIGQMKPLTRAHDYYNIFKGGATGRSLATLNTIVPFWYKHYPVEEYLPTVTSKDRNDICKMKGKYDYILCWGRDDEFFEILKREGVILIHQKGRVWLYKTH